MPTQPSRPEEAPRSKEPRRDEVPPTPDEAGPHDVPDDEVIEQTLPARAKRDPKNSER